VIAGIIAYLVSVLVSVLLIFLTYRINTILTSKTDEERYLLAGNRSVAIALGSIVLSQAILLRHAVFPAMTVIRELFLRPVTFSGAMWVIANCLLFFFIIGILSIASVWLTGWLFIKMTRKIPEHDEILKDNVAIAIFFAFVLIGVTLILNEGLEDLSRSLIPYTERGIIRLP
jgi:uncharacterized membrane protein YjfL (UPF0719 family)